jgi:GNAT superfamily N-acetyltransferase
MGGAPVARVRLAEAGDADAIGRIQVAAWRRAYAGFLPAAFLDGLDAEERAARARTRIGPAAHADSPTFVALDATDTVRGFAHTGPVRDDDLDPAGRAEVYTVYVDPAAWRLGFGSALLSAVEGFWQPTGVSELVLWVFEDNLDGRAFYERLGWIPDGARLIDDFGGVHPAEIRLRRRL